MFFVQLQAGLMKVVQCLNRSWTHGSYFSLHIGLIIINSPKPHLLLSLHSSFTPNLKHCSSTNPILISPLPPTSLPVSTPNTIHHSRLTACLPDSLDLTRCLSILFWISACEYAGSHDFAIVGAVEISSYDYD